MLKLDDAQDRSPRRLDRRAFTAASVSALAGVGIWRYRNTAAVEAGPVPSGQLKMVEIAEFSDARERQGVALVSMIVKSDEESRKQLSRSAFDITRKADTEIAFTGPYWNLHKNGLFRCICCDTALFNSEAKFDSGTGWPSFWAPVAKENLNEFADRSWGVDRTAVSFRRCDSHLGHVFNDQACRFFRVSDVTRRSITMAC
jgi:peptide-methionine (R)-S-oxide reductase